jgi:hypothetical protein
MPDVTADELLAVRRSWWRHFIFYRRERTRVTGFCSCCGKEMVANCELDGSGDFLEDLWHAKHKAEGLCPICRAKVTYMAAGRFRDFSSLMNYDNIVFILPVNGGQVVYLRCYTVYADYEADKLARLCFVEKAHYRLAPGEWQMEKRSFAVWDCYAWQTLAYYKGHYSGCYMGKWRSCKTPQEPWQGFMWCSMYYSFLHAEKLEDTFLKYSRMWDFDRLNPRRGVTNYYNGGEYGAAKDLTYLCYYTKYPSLEIAMRTNGGEAARDLIYLRRSNRHLINWRAKDPLRFWRLSKVDFKKTVGVDDRLEFLRVCKPYFGKLPMEDLVRLYNDGERNVTAFFELLDLLPGEKPLKVLRYCYGHSNQYIGFYRDYLEAARDVGRDLTVHNVRFPKDLQQAHDEAVAARKLMEEAEKRAEWEKKAAENAKQDAKRRKLYDYAADGFFIRVADNGPEIVAEGNALHHCVGGYVERHLTCQTTILFLRSVDEPDEPFYTVEMRGKQLQQVHGFRNCAISGEAEAFFNKWLDWVKAGGGLAKQNQQTSAKVQTTERKAV